MTFPYRKALSQKILPQFSEHCIVFFTKCNLNCSFCAVRPHENERDRVCPEAVTNQQERLKRFITQDDNTIYAFNLMGGELFAEDTFTDAMYDAYLNFVVDVDTHLTSLGKRGAFRFASNLIFNHVEKVERFFIDLERLGVPCKLVPSYDFIGRFSAKTLPQFKKNVEQLKPLIKEISITLTTPSIKKLLKDNDSYFKYLYATFPIYFDYYAPEVHATHNTPSDETMLEALIFLSDRYPLAEPIQSWINAANASEHTFQPMICTHCRIFTFEDTSTLEPLDCGECVITDTEFKSHDMKKGTMLLNFLEEHDCFNCRHYQRCGLGCFLFHYTRKRQISKQCIYSCLLDHLIAKGKPLTGRLST